MLYINITILLIKSTFLRKYYNVNKVQIHYQKILRFVFWLAFPILILFSVFFFQNNSYWEYYQLHWDITLVSLGIILINLFLYKILNLTNKNYPLLNIILILGISFFLLTIFSSVKINIYLNLLFIFLSFGFANFFTSINKFNKSILFNYLLGIVLLQFCFFFLSSLSLLKQPLILTLFVGISIIGLILNVKSIKNVKNILKISLNNTEALTILILSAVLFYSFMLTCLPQTQSDGLVYRLTFLEQIKRLGTIPFHYYLWDWATPQGMKLVLIPGYFFNGEYGASTQIFIFFLLLVRLLYKIFDFFLEKKDLSLIFTVIIISSPFIWVQSFSIFFEVPILVFLLAGLSSILYYEKSSNVYYMAIAAVCLAFACIIKINILFFVLVLSCLYILSKYFGHLYYSNKFIHNHFIFYLIIIVFILFPWLVWTTIETGNPFFPFFPDFLFESKFKANVINPAHLDIFNYPLNLKNIILLPINLFVNGYNFHSFPGGTNIWSIYFFYSIFFLLLINPLKTSNFLFILLITSFLTIFATNLFSDGTLVLRYWIHAYVIIMVVSLILLETKIQLFSFNYISKTLNVVILLWCLIFLSAAGVRMNFEIILGQHLFWNESKLNEMRENIAFGIDSFVNQNISEEENVAVTGQFYPVHKFNTHAFTMNSSESLFGKVSNLEKTREFIKKEKIRYWIVDTKDRSGFIDQYKEMKFLSDKNIVFGNKHFVIYDLVNDVKYPLKSTEMQYQNKKSLTQAIPKNTLWANFIVDINSSIGENTVIIKKLIFDKEKNIVYEDYENRVLNKGSNQLYLPTIMPNNASEIYIEIYEWKPNTKEEITFIKISSSYY